MYITEDLVIKVVSGIFIEVNAKMNSLLFGGDVISQIYIDPATGVVTVA